METIIGILLLILTTFYLKMMIYCTRHQKTRRSTWIIVTVFGGPMGALSYYLSKDKNSPRKKPRYRNLSDINSHLDELE